VRAVEDVAAVLARRPLGEFGDEHLGAGHDRRKGRAEIVRKNGEDRAPKALGLDLEEGFLGGSHQLQALEGARHERRVGVELTAFLGDA
jgi:hypothetical protein